MLLEEIKEYAKTNKVPIMEEEGISFLTNYIKENNIKDILEIGSAIGYSAIKMALVSSDVKVMTIERNEDRYQKAIINIDKMHLKDQITIYKADALEFSTNDKFDLIFIDAAKSQYINFFNKYKTNLKENGVIITDNINFHDLRESDSSLLSRNVRGIIRKLNLYVEFLHNNESFETSFINVGDGIAISRLKGE